MGRRHPIRRSLSARVVAALLLAAGPVLAGAQTWSGAGPFPPNADSHTIRALTVDRATGVVYAGAGSGTVFALRDASLSRPPVAASDSIVIDPQTTTDIDVLANDTDPEGALDTGSVEIQNPPANGTATANASGTVTYASNAGFIGTDNFSYTVRDQAGNASNTASVSVRVNASPVAGADTANTQEEEPVTIDVLANDSDPGGALDPASVVIWNSPANGWTDIAPDGRITYTPAPNFSGTDSFTYRVGDHDGGLSNEATVTVTVTPAVISNDPPPSPSPPPPPSTPPRRRGGGSIELLLLAALMVVRLLKERASGTACLNTTRES